MIGICSVIYNKLDFVKRTVEAVLENTTPPYVYVLVYNDSPYPGVKEYIESLESDFIRIIWNRENKGVTKAYKQGYDFVKQMALVHYFAKIDDDTIIQTKDWDKKMIEAIEEFYCRSNPVAILSANIDSGKQVGPFKELQGPFDKNIIIEVFDNPCVGGACTVYPIELFEKIGFFKDFGYYGQEDGEFANRAVEAGYFTAYLRDVHCKHLGRTKESDPLLDAWKLEAWSQQTKKEFRIWAKEKYGKIVK